MDSKNCRKEPVGKGVISSGSIVEMSGEKFDEKYNTKL